MHFIEQYINLRTCIVKSNHERETNTKKHLNNKLLINEQYIYINFLHLMQIFNIQTQLHASNITIYETNGRAQNENGNNKLLYTLFTRST